MKNIYSFLYMLVLVGVPFCFLLQLVKEMCFPLYSVLGSPEGG